MDMLSVQAKGLRESIGTELASVTRLGLMQLRTRWEFLKTGLMASQEGLKELKGLALEASNQGKRSMHLKLSDRTEAPNIMCRLSQDREER